MKTSFLYIILLLISAPLWSQFGGGNGRGESSILSASNQLNGILPALYGGGNGRGESVIIVTGNQLDGATPVMFGGGNGRGEFVVNNNNSQLDGAALQIYRGGIGRGENIIIVTNSELNGPLLNIFGGGIGRGEFVKATNTNQLDGNNPNLYGGGIGRGETLFGAYTAQLDGLVENSMYLGGNGRGETVQQTVSSALPVTVTSFGAFLAGSQIRVQWQTAGELNSAFFGIEKSLDGNSWQTLGKVAAAGHSDKPLAYQFYDTHPAEGINYYRLKPTDLDGRFTYSAVAAVHYHLSTGTSIIVYPNPVTYQFTILVQGQQAATAKLHITLVNAQGQTVFTKENLTGNTQTFNISKLAAGLYYLVIDNNGAVSTTKIVKN